MARHYISFFFNSRLEVKVKCILLSKQKRAKEFLECDGDRRKLGVCVCVCAQLKMAKAGAFMKQ